MSEELGRGGMSVVYAAQDTESGDEVAVKIVSMTAATDGDWKGYELFERSSRVLQHLDHPGLPRVLAFEQDDAGAFVLVRERFDGGTLLERGRVSPERFGQLLLDLLGLLEFLQTRQPPIVHRDIKPSNIMFRAADDWTPVLVDFDTVALPSGSGLTLVGTPGYAAPEQLMGETSEASDVFGLGATLLFAATGVEPEKLERKGGRYVLEGRLDGLMPRHRRILEKMVEPTLRKRYDDASEALVDLRRVEGSLAPTTLSSRMPTGRSRTVMIAALILVPLIGGVIFAWIASSQKDEDEAAGFVGSTEPGEPSHEALLEAGLAAMARGDTEDYAERLFAPWPLLERLCSEGVSPRKLKRFKSRQAREKRRAREAVTACHELLDINRAKRVRFAPGARDEVIEECGGRMVRYKRGTATYILDGERYDVRLRGAISIDDPEADATRWYFSGDPDCKADP